jgi:hypothetical protein
MKAECDRIWEVDALREGRLSRADAAAHHRHREVCEACRRRFAEDERLAALGRALDAPEPDALRTRRLRASILREAAVAASPARRWIAPAAFAAALGLGATLYVARHEVPARAPLAGPVSGDADAGERFAATVTAMPGARWSRRRDGDVERTMLEEGTIALVVQKRHAGERFLVELPDGEVEVRGTTFELTVRARMTTSIHVEEGVVVFRRPHAPDVVLGEMETWRAEDTASPTVASSKRLATAAPERAATSEYAAAVAAYHAQRYADAAQLFSAFVAAHPQAAEAEDAAFLEASALAHGGNTDAASAAAQRFLGRYPGSFHARDAAILAARGARDRGDCPRARRFLEPWIQHPTPDLTTALGSCSSD